MGQTRFVVAGLLVGVLQAGAQSAPVVPKGEARPAAEKVTSLPVRRIALYKNGVGFFEQAGQVSGNELVQLDFTTGQLNDALQSLTTVDLGGGKITGAGYDADVPLSQQIERLAPGLGPDPTVLDYFHAIKGAKVEVHTGAAVLTGRLFNVEVRMVPGLRGEAPVEKRYLSLVSDGGGLKTVELTPSVEVRLVGKDSMEIGKYLQVLSSNRGPGMRHLMLEDHGTGEREVQVSYLSAVPAWKSSYRVLFGDKDKDAATLQGWAVVDNTGATDWENVQLTLVSGAPQSFIQQISRPLNITRPEIGLPGGPVAGGPPVKFPAVMGGMSARFDPIGEGQGQTVAMHGGAIGGGEGVEVSQVMAKADGPVSEVQDYAASAKNSLATQTTSVDLGDLFEYRLSKPITIKKGESATVPILQAEVGAKRVTVWNPHPKLGGAGPDKAMRSLWLTNTSDLTLDRGSFSIVEDGIFGGQGQMDLMHPKEKRVVPYAVDEAVSVDFHEGKRLAPKLGHVVIADGKISMHRMYPRVREYTIHNTGSARTVLLEPERTDRFQMEPGRPRLAAVWELSPETPAPAEVTDQEYKFAVEVGASSTATFKLVETHSHPQKYDLATISEDDLKGLAKEAAGNSEVMAQLQPLLDAKHQLAEIGKKLKTTQSGMDGVKLEEKRIRDNMAALPKDGGSGLAKRYSDEMNAQEDKMAGLQKDREALLAQKDSIQKGLEDKLAGLKVDVRLVVAQGV